MYQHGGDIYTNQNMIDFSANINFRGMPKSVEEAARQSIPNAIHYPDVQCRELKSAIAKLEQVKEEQIICGNGAADVIFSLVLARKPRQALVPIPSFYEYQQALASVNCRILSHSLKQEAGFKVQEDILEQITPEVDMLFICSPNNPTGLLVEKNLLLQILDRCERTDTLLVLDECFLNFVENQEDYSMVSEIEKSQHLFILKAFTKMYAMPGLRLGYGLCGNQKLLQEMNRVSQPWRVSVPAMAAGIAATKEVDFVQDSRRETRILREELKQELQNLGCQIWESQANYIFFYMDRDIVSPLKQQGILIRDCSNYPGLSKGFYRVAVRCRQDNEKLIEALKNID